MLSIEVPYLQKKTRRRKFKKRKNTRNILRYGIVPCGGICRVVIKQEVHLLLVGKGTYDSVL